MVLIARMGRQIGEPSKSPAEGARIPLRLAFGDIANTSGEFWEEPSVRSEEDRARLREADLQHGRGTSINVVVQCKETQMTRDNREGTADRREVRDARIAVHPSLGPLPTVLVFDFARRQRVVPNARRRARALRSYPSAAPHTSASVASSAQRRCGQPESRSDTSMSG